MTNPTPSQINLIRSIGQGVQLYLAKFEPNIVFQAQINDANIQKGSKLITFDNVITGSFSNIVGGQSLYIGSAIGGNDVGRVRARSATSSQITAAVDDEINYKDNEYLTVKDFYEIWPVFPFSSLNTGTKAVTFFKDWDITYSDQNLNFDPIIIMGPDFAGFWDIFQTSGIYFTATGSYTIDGSSISSYAWTFPAGCSITNSSSGTPGNVTFPAAGMYTVSLAVTASNGKTATSHRHIMLLNRSYGTIGGYGSVQDTYGSIQPFYTLPFQDIDDWEFGEITQDNIIGAIAKVTVRSRANEFKKGDLIVIFAEEYYNGVYATTSPVSYGHYPGREHIVFVGYVDQATTNYDFVESATEFVLKGSAAYLQNKEMFSVQVNDTQGTPADWTHIKNLTIQKALIHYIRWHSTLLNVKDFNKLTTGEGSYQTQIVQFPKDEILTNITNFMQNKLLGFCSSDIQGSFYTEIDLNILATGSRPASAMVFIEDDWVGTPKVDEITEQPYSNILYGGLEYNPSVAAFNTGVPLLSRAPGQFQSYTGKSQNISGLVLTSQSQLNVIAGMDFYKKNNITPTLQLDLANNMRFIDCYPQQFYDYNISGTITYRGFPSWTPKRIIPRKFTYKLKDFSLLQNIIFETETYGPAGDTIIIPTTLPPGGCTTCNTPPPCDCTANPSCEGCPPPVGEGDKSHVVVGTINHIGYTTNFRDSSPTWVDKASSITISSLFDLCLDSFDPVNRVAFLDGTTLYTTPNFQASTPTWTSTNLTSIVANMMNARIISSSITDQGTYWIGFEANDNGFSVPKDAGILRIRIDPITFIPSISSAAAVVLAADSGALVSTRVGRIVQDFDDSNSAWILIDCSNTTTKGGIFKATYNPGSQTVSQSAKVFSPDAFDHVWDFDTSFTSAPGFSHNHFAYMRKQGTASHSFGIYIGADTGGYSLAFNEPLNVVGNYALSNTPRYSVNVATWDGTDVLLAQPKLADDGSGGTYAFYRTKDSFTTVTKVFTGGTTNNPSITAVGRWPFTDGKDIIYFLAFNESDLNIQIGYSEDGLTTVQNKIGNWVSVFGAWPGTDVGMIVPIWLSF